MQQKFWPSDWESYLYAPTQWTVSMHWSYRYSFIEHHILLICMFNLNDFAHEISLQSLKKIIENIHKIDFS